MTIQRILVPFNFMLYDRKALDFVIRTFSGRGDVEITLFNSYTPLPEIEMKQSPVMEKLRENLSFMTAKIKELEEGLKNAKQDLLQNGFSDHQVRLVLQPRKKKDIASEIIALAMKHNFNLIVVNHKPGKVSHFFTGPVFNKVITTLKDITVCVIT